MKHFTGLQDRLNLLIFLFKNDYQGEITSTVYWDHSQREEGTVPPPLSPLPFVYLPRQTIKKMTETSSDFLVMLQRKRGEIFSLQENSSPKRFQMHARIQREADMQLCMLCNSKLSTFSTVLTEDLSLMSFISFTSVTFLHHAPYLCQKMAEIIFCLVDNHLNLTNPLL